MCGLQGCCLYIKFVIRGNKEVAQSFVGISDWEDSWLEIFIWKKKIPSGFLRYQKR